MRKTLLIFILFFSLAIQAQTVFWTETFNNGCVQNCLAGGVNTGNGAWSTATSGVNGATPNLWYISCAENGQAVGTCGAACGANATLHLGAVGNSDCGCLVCPTGDCGAAYDACNGATFCGGSPQTNQRAISPLISTVGFSGISVSFDYIERGQGASDDGLAYYSTNGGASWTLLINTAKTAIVGACAGQGFWTNYTSAALPAACDNIANFMISFVWVNNADGLGNDPSYAINDLKIRYTTLLPIELIDFTYSSLPNATSLNWETATEKNSDYFEILKSEDGIYFNSIGNVKASGNSNKLKKYNFRDDKISNSVAYYKLKMVDLDQSFEYSPLIAVDVSNSLGIKNNCFLNTNNEIEIGNDYALVNRFETISIYDVEGKMIAKYSLPDYKKGNKILIPAQILNRGIYLAELIGSSSAKSHKIFIP